MKRGKKYLEAAILAYQIFQNGYSELKICFEK